MAEWIVYLTVHTGCQGFSAAAAFTQRLFAFLSLPVVCRLFCGTAENHLSGDTALRPDSRGLSLTFRKDRDHLAREKSDSPPCSTSRILIALPLFSLQSKVSPSPSECDSSVLCVFSQA